MIARPDWDLPVVYAPDAPPLDEEGAENERIPIDRAAVEKDLGPSGAVARVLAQYEDRESQREMAGVVADLYNDGGVGLLEAGTGVGKSLAYLVPALRWAAANGQRTVVSTNTINLQEQLVRKDLPFLADAFEGEQEVKFALLKGWRNYLCLLRLAQSKLLASSLLADDSRAELDAIAEVFSGPILTTGATAAPRIISLMINPTSTTPREISSRSVKVNAASQRHRSRGRTPPDGSSTPRTDEWCRSNSLAIWWSVSPLRQRSHIRALWLSV